jgi:hypothetical protein
MRYIGFSVPWSITNALKWRRQHQQYVTDQAALTELVQVCCSGRVRILGTRRNASPYWPAARKIAIQLGNPEEAFIPAAEFDDPYFELDNNFSGGTLNWKSSRAVAWWPVAFASDELVVAWLDFITPSHVNAPAEIAATLPIQESEQMLVAFLSGALQDESVQSEPASTLTLLVNAAGDNQKPQKRGPRPGTVDRFGTADRALYPEFEALLRPADPNVPTMSRSEASLQLAQAGKIRGVGTSESRAKRLRDRYTDDHPYQ